MLLIKKKGLSTSNRDDCTHDDRRCAHLKRMEILRASTLPNEEIQKILDDYDKVKGGHPDNRLVQIYRNTLDKNDEEPLIQRLKSHPDPYSQPPGTHPVEVPGDFYTLEKTTFLRYNNNKKFQ